MNRRMRAAAVATVLAATAALSGCSYLESTAPERTPSAVEACAMGKTWRLDLDAVQQTVAAAIPSATEVVVEGKQTLDWGTNGDVTLDSDYTIRVTAPSDVAETPYVVTQTISGVVTGRAYFSDIIAIPRNWDASRLSIETTAVKGEETLETPPLTIPKTVIDDIVGLEVQCSAESMTMQGRGTHFIVHWLPAS